MVPFVIESTGVWGESPLKLAKEIGRRITARDGDNRAASSIRQRIAVEVQRENSRLIAGGVVSSGALRELGSL